MEDINIIEYENTTRKAIKNPFAKIHEAALNNGGSLPDDVRKKMMGEAIKEIRDNIQVNNLTHRHRAKNKCLRY